MNRLMVGRMGDNFAAEEISSLMDGDIPLFTTKTDELTQEQRNIYNYSALDNTLQKVRDMNEIDLSRQITIMYASFQKIPDYKTNITCKSTGGKQVNYKECYLEVCEQIAEDLLEKAIVFEKNGVKNYTWLGTSENENGILDVKDLGNDLYYGRSGIAFFFLCLSKYSKNPKYREVACVLIEEMALDIRQAKEFGKEIGLFNGLSSCLFLMLYATKLGVCQCKDEIIKLMNMLKEKVAGIEDSDIISGQAGIMSLMLYVWESIDDSDLKEIALQIVKIIKEELKSHVADTTCIWGKEGYIGYAHGNAGISAQLARANVLLQDEKLETLIRRSIEIENEAFDVEKRNWARTTKHEQYLGHGWCHGAPGILLSRTLMKEYGVKDDVVERDIDMAIDICKEKFIGEDFCLCHGDVGNLLILRRAAITCNKTELLKYTDEMMNRLLGQFYYPEIKEGDKKKLYDNPGIMCGFSGIGYALIKFAGGEDIIDILCLSEGV